MARKNSTTATEAESTPTEAVEAPAAEATPEAPIDLGPFQSVVNAAVETRDKSTGVVAEDELAKVTEAYRSLEGVKPKNAAKSWVEERMMEAVGALDGQLARAYSLAKEALVAGGGSKSSERKPADPTAAYVQRVASLTLALSIAQGKRPEGVAEDADEQVGKLVAESGEGVTALQAWLDNTAEDKGDAPEVSNVVKAAFKFAEGKGGGSKRQPHTGPTGDVAKHVTEAFAEHPVGHVLKVSEIANFKSSEYPNGNASQGAISARLFPSSGKATTIPGVEAVERDDNGPRRARKIA